MMGNNITKAIILSFSGRKDSGNCEKISNFIIDELNNRIISKKLELKSLKIEPCVGCNYECFIPQKGCPKNDHINMIYSSIIESDICIFVIPVYSGAPPALYFAWRERSQGVFTNEKLYEEYRKVKKFFIIIGNENAGAREAIKIVQDEEGNYKAPVLLIQSHKYNKSSIAGNLIQCEEVKIEIREFLSHSIEHKSDIKI